MIERRSFLRGLLAAPAVVAASSLMPIKPSLAYVRPHIILHSGTKFYCEVPWQSVSLGIGRIIPQKNIIKLGNGWWEVIV